MYDMRNENSKGKICGNCSRVLVPTIFIHIEFQLGLAPLATLMISVWSMVSVPGECYLEKNITSRN
jgi:hypothetical protein